MPRLLVVTAATITCLCLYIEASDPARVAQFPNLFEHGLQMRFRGGMGRSSRTKRDVQIPGIPEQMRGAFMDLVTEAEVELEEAAAGTRRKKKCKRPRALRFFPGTCSYERRLRRGLFFLYKFFNDGGVPSSPGLTGLADLMMSFDEEPTTTPADTTTTGVD